MCREIYVEASVELGRIPEEALFSCLGEENSNSLLWGLGGREHSSIHAVTDLLEREQSQGKQESSFSEKPGIAKANKINNTQNVLSC